MPGPTVSLRVRKFRRRFGIAAPRVVVRTHWPWRWRLSLAFAMVMLCLILLYWLWGAGQVRGVSAGVDVLQRELATQAEELQALRSLVGTDKNAFVIERAAQEGLMQRIAALERENALLREDIRFFERLVPGAGGAGQLRIENLRVAAEGGGRYRYHLLLAFQPDRQLPELHATMQFRLLYRLGEQRRQLMLPDSAARAGEFTLDIKQFARREGVLNLPPEAILISVEVSILQGGGVKARRSLQL